MRIITLAICLLSTVSSIFAQQTKILTPEKHNEYGLVYTLPVTALEIEVTAVKETQIAGPYFQYANKFLADSKVLEKDRVIWSIENVNVRPYGVPDTENRYIMQLKPGATTYIGVADDGMLLSINKEPETPEPDDVTQSSKPGAIPTGKEYLEYVNEDFIAAKSSLKQAQILAEELAEIREAKLALTRGTAETMPTDGRQLEIMLSSLDQQEKAITRAFTGSSWSERFVKKFSFIPEEDGREVIFRISDFNGIVNKNDYSGEPVYIYISLNEETEMQPETKGPEKKMPKDAVIYCVPGSANISITDGNTTYFSQDFEFSQFGKNFGLNPSLFTDKKQPSFAVFDPATGAIKEIGSVK